ncbi:MAG: glycosyltransferase, partial [Halothiobacillaceae bacterium]
LSGQAAAAGVAPGRLVLTGFVPEQDLLDLYNLASLFVFPSFSEGFGLPALEAMACGTATIVSNCSSLPEVVGREDALFDPNQPETLVERMTRALEDQAWREDLARHGRERARGFSWAQVAERSLAAWEAALHQGIPKFASSGNGAPGHPSVIHAPSVPPRQRMPSAFRPRRPRLACIAPLPPSRSGIADYVAMLLPALARYYDLELVAPQETLADPWLQANFPLRDIPWFERHAGRYDRVLYHMGNSSFHGHIPSLLERRPGVVVQHDFFVTDLRAHLDSTRATDGGLADALFHGHGYRALDDLQRDGADAVRKVYPACLDLLENALGVLVHSQHARDLARQHYPWIGQDNWHTVAMPRARPLAIGRDQARQRLDIPADCHLCISLGFIAPTKASLELIEAWARGLGARDHRAILVLVGEKPPDEYGGRLQGLIDNLPVGNRIRITGYVDREDYACWVRAADLAVQLRRNTRGETSAAVHDCLRAGLPLLVSATGSLAEIPDDAAWKLPADFSVGDLQQAIERVAVDPGLARAYGRRAARHAESCCAPERVARQYVEAIESIYASPPVTRKLALFDGLRQALAQAPRGTPAASLAVPVARNLPARQPPTCYVDLGSIQPDRLAPATRHAIAALLLAPPTGWRVELVTRTEQEAPRVAHDLACRWLGLPERPPKPLLVLKQDAWLQIGSDLDSTRQWHLPTLRGRCISPETLPTIDREWLEDWLCSND